MTAKLIGVAGGGDEDLVIALDRNDLPVIETSHDMDDPDFCGIRMGSLEQAELVHALLGRAIKAAKTNTNGHTHASASNRTNGTAAHAKKRPQRRRPRPGGKKPRQYASAA